MMTMNSKILNYVMVTMRICVDHVLHIRGISKISTLTRKQKLLIMIDFSLGFFPPAHQFCHVVHFSIMLKYNVVPPKYYLMIENEKNTTFRYKTQNKFWGLQ